MELIYSDENGVEKDVLKKYELDLEYGGTENSFQLTLNSDNPCIQKNYKIHVINTSDGKEIGTAYGGIVDEIISDTENKIIMYKGRTWQGVINGHVIEPDEECDYRLIDGEANQVLRELIELMKLTDLFEVLQSDSGIEIQSYEMERYTQGYKGMCNMLSKHNAKLDMEYNGEKVLLSAKLTNDYSDDEEFNQEVVNFKIGKKYNAANHIICAGEGDLSERYIIHLFTDENGGIQPYTNVDNPVQDKDYILDKSKQILVGSAEICEFKDYKKADVTKNYVLLSVQPEDWNVGYGMYYFYDDEEEKYVSAKATEINTYVLLSQSPQDWTENYGNYWIKNSDRQSGYESVAATESKTYKKLTKRPNGWKKKYSDYYYKFTDGVTTEYVKASGRIVYTYKKQTRQPSDWEKNYTSYYIRKKDGGFENIKTGKDKKAPKWEKGKYFTKYSETKAPVFKAKDYYRVIVTEIAPIFKSNLYYSKTVKVCPPPFVKDKYYEQVLDHYAVMVKDAVAYIEEKILDGDTLEIELNPIKEYEVGDWVGGTDRITGQTVIQQITKKVVKINEKNKTPIITYDVGPR